jgi:hypothetical protein
MTNPNMTARARTARLVREAQTPVFSTSTPTPAQVRADLITRAQDAACGEDFCFICSRATDHWGEHSDEQILAWSTTYRGKMLMGL